MNGSERPRRRAAEIVVAGRRAERNLFCGASASNQGMLHRYFPRTGQIGHKKPKGQVRTPIGRTTATRSRTTAYRKHRTVPSIRAIMQSPCAAARPSHTGGEGRSWEAIFPPSSLRAAQTRPPFSPAKLLDSSPSSKDASNGTPAATTVSPATVRASPDRGICVDHRSAQFRDSGTTVPI